jgi:FKBP-type peptidyl-prolyl cis-trans isomerase FkpA
MNQQQTTSLKTLMASLTAALLIAACGQPGGAEMPANEDTENAAAEPAGTEAVSNEPITELQIIDVVEGDGDMPAAGQNIVVHYTGWLYEPQAEDNKGNKFDSSVDRGQPFVFPLGQGRVIRGWDEGFAGMKIGGKRILIIPPDMGYGAAGAGGAIPPNATLMFEVELLEIQ